MNDAQPRVAVAAGSMTRRHGAWVVTGAVLLLIVLRFHAFPVPLEADECNYAYIAGRLLAGDRLYVDVWDHQPSGVYLLYAAATWIAGDAPETFRGLAMGFAAVSLLLVYAIGRRLAGVPGGALAAVLWAMVSSDPGTAGEGCNREVFMNTFVLAAWWVALCTERRMTIRALAAGALLGAGSVLKTILAVHWVLLAGWLLVQTAKAHRRPGGAWDRRHAAIVVLLFGAGPAALWTATVAYFAADGRLAVFWDAVFAFNVSYSSGIGWGERFTGFFRPHGHPYRFDSAMPLWLCGAAALSYQLWLVLKPSILPRRSGANVDDDEAGDGGAAPDGMPRSRSAAVLLLLNAANFVAVCLPAQFWPHYFHLMLPGMCLAVGVSLAQGLRLRERLRNSAAAKEPVLRTAGAVRRWGFGIATGVVIVAVALQQYRAYLSQPPLGITVQRYNTRDFWARAMGEKVAQATDADDFVFVFANDPGIYYYSGRRCGSRFTMITGVQARFAGSERRRAWLMEDLRRTRPRLILVLMDEPPFEEWKSFLREEYGQPIGWDFHDATGEPILFVLSRHDAPVVPVEWSWHRSELNSAAQP